VELLESETGQDYSIAKLHTREDGYAVLRNKSTGEYIAYNVDKMDRDVMTSLSDFQAVLGSRDVISGLDQVNTWVESGYSRDIYEYYDVEVYDSFCDCYYWEERSYWVGTEWVDTSHWVTTYHGGGFIFDNNAVIGKDLDTFAAIKEDVQKKFVTYKIKSELALSQTRAEELADLAIKYEKLESIRELTASEKSKFTQSSLGSNFDEIEAALKKKAQGNENSYNNLMAKAAQVNKTSPEQIASFFDKYISL